jgi:glucarate dehydratase
MRTFRIVNVRATTVAVPLKAALRHSNGCHWARFVPTLVDVEIDQGLSDSASGS